MPENALKAEIKTILHPTDFSDSSNHALEYAVVLAKQFGAKLYILHVVEDVSTAFYFAEGQAPPAVPLLTDLQQRASEALERILPPETAGAIQTERLIRVGAPFLEIIRCAKSIKADMIVLGTHGRGRLKHLIFGSVAENVVRKSPCPVLSVRHPSHKFEMPG